MRKRFVFNSLYSYNSFEAVHVGGIINNVLTNVIFSLITFLICPISLFVWLKTCQLPRDDLFTGKNKQQAWIRNKVMQTWNARAFADRTSN